MAGQRLLVCELCSFPIRPCCEHEPGGLKLRHIEPFPSGVHGPYREETNQQKQPGNQVALGVYPPPLKYVEHLDGCSVIVKRDCGVGTDFNDLHHGPRAVKTVLGNKDPFPIPASLNPSTIFHIYKGDPGMSGSPLNAQFYQVCVNLAPRSLNALSRA